MQTYTVYDKRINIGALPVPNNCAGRTTRYSETPSEGVPNETVFWFPDDDKTQNDMNAIDLAIASHVYGSIDIRRNIGTNTYEVCIATTEPSVTPIVDGVVLALMPVVDETACFTVTSDVSFRVSTVELDAGEVTHNVN